MTREYCNLCKNTGYMNITLPGGQKRIAVCPHKKGLHKKGIAMPSVNVVGDKFDFLFPIEKEINWKNERVYVIEEAVQISTTIDELVDFFSSKFDMDYRFDNRASSLYFYNDILETSVLITSNDFKEEITGEYYSLLIRYKGKRDFVKGLKGDFHNSFNFESSSKIYVDWYYDSGGMITSDRLPMKESKTLFVPEFYPYIENLDKWVDGFIQGDKNVLILLGEPGTGKSTLIREIIAKSEIRSFIAYDEELMKSDSLYLRFTRDVFGNDDKSGILILEDADLLILEREQSNNTAMSKLLNMSDGILDTSKMKFIFTANIEDKSRIDRALTRPGRCYDIVEFRKLTLGEAEIAAEKAGIEFEKPSGQFTVAEIYNNQNNRTPARQGIGFS